MMSGHLGGIEELELKRLPLDPLLELDLEPAAHPTLGSGVWLLKLSVQDEVTSRLWPLLAVDERARAQAFRVAHAKAQYVQVRGVLRLLLERSLDVPAADIRFCYDSLRKPALAGHDGWYFNVSHSGQYALICIAHGREVGVDIEQHRAPLELESMLNMVLSPAEIKCWEAQPPDRRVAMFFTLWTAKEAVAKAVGQGLRIDFPSLSVRDLSDGALDGVRRVAVGAFGDCQLAALPAPIGYAAALALRWK